MSRTKKTAPRKAPKKNLLKKALDQATPKSFGCSDDVNPLPAFNCTEIPQGQYRIRLNEESRFQIYTRNGCKIDIDGKELIAAIELKSAADRAIRESMDDFKRRRNIDAPETKPLVDIPKEGTLTPKTTAYQVAIDLFEKRMKDVNSCLENQLNRIGDSSYSLGMYNGMECIAAIMEGRQPEYQAPKMEAVELQANNAEAPSPEQLVKEFIDKIVGRENIFPALAEKLNSYFYYKLGQDAELMTERTRNARDRFDQLHKTMVSFAQGTGKKD